MSKFARLQVEMVRSLRLTSSSLTTTVLLAGVLVACGSPAAEVPAAEPPAAVEPDDAAAIPEDIAEAIDVRGRYGLRADVAWVQAVAEHPDAVIPEDWGIPLLPEELADLLSRQWPNDLLVQVRNYGLQFPDDFATAYVNLKGTGIVIEFKANVERHRAALAGLPHEAPIEVRQAEWSLKDLEGFLEEVNAQKGWIESLGARFVWVDVYELEHAVRIRYEGTAGLEGIIAEHFGNPRWLRVAWGGPGPWKGPRGDLMIQIRHPDGRPVPGVWCELVPEGEAADEGFDETSFESDRAGACVMRDLPAVAYHIKLHALLPDGRHDRVPTKEFDILLDPAGATVPVIIDPGG